MTQVSSEEDRVIMSQGPYRERQHIEGVEPIDSSYELNKVKDRGVRCTLSHLSRYLTQRLGKRVFMSLSSVTLHYMVHVEVTPGHWRQKKVPAKAFDKLTIESALKYLIGEISRADEWDERVHTPSGST